MSATLWIDEGKEVGVELGGTLQLYAAMSELRRAVPDWWSTAMSGVLTQVETAQDAPSEWLLAVRAEARRMLQVKGLSEHSRWVLSQLAQGADDDSDTDPDIGSPG